MIETGKNLNRLLLTGITAFLTTTAIANSPGLAAGQPALSPSATTETPAAATLQDPADAAAALDQQSSLQGTGDVELSQPTEEATAPASTSQPAQAAAANADNSLSSSAILERLTGNQDAQEVTAPPLQAPPGLDLPLSDLPEEKTDAQKEAEIRQQAFGAASSGLMPMKTDEIRKLLEMYDETQQAVQTPIYPNPKPESTFQTISLDPGTAPVELKTAIGHVTTLSIVDASGQPWPIQDISWAGNFEVLQPETGSNMLRITPMADFAFGNVSMRLVGLNPPVIFTMRTDRKGVQVRADVQIPELGPNGVAAPIQRQVTTTAGDQSLSTILEGVPPASASKLRIEGIDGRTTAYEAGGVTYVRTPYTLLSPAWDSSVRSADGTNVYAMKFTPVLLLSDKGKMVRAQLKKADISDEQ
ncbi:MAG: type IV secretion protein DotH [Micavibrio aeruginosavorus]|uniref:Type IV secretion protein DotH n=1 Tax=Micavibrio aeruginosavorus TaxID=349221 RepID=A0A2W5FQN7_9BACT|nr:MAG: type IV secretion protein DotH [Micavibrio aeruginosavorus]